MAEYIEAILIDSFVDGAVVHWSERGLRGAVVEVAAGETYQFTHTAMVVDENLEQVSSPSIDTGVTWMIRYGLPPHSTGQLLATGTR